ncbi:MAG TPA: flagellar basal body P-ring formation chaperone FlgA [Candidatus Sulfotelmatobacter sp.]|jgi:flagella basal body P-ring formation protein FlgA|nr:flagellar basal body P-ring formation chaperone FlgA [Candidatus Sulfotelmatobacter sp.]
MKRFAITIAATAALAAGLLSSPARADVTLRPNVLVDGDVVKLGDLFDNLPDKADTPVARSPAPGRRVTVDSEWLARVAHNYNVAWKPSSNFDQAVVERSGVLIGHEQIEQELRNALSGEDLPKNSDIELTNRAIDVTVPIGSATTIGVRDMIYDKRYNRFTATVEIPANTPNAQRIRVAGRVYAMVDVPVLSHAINRGDVISAHDLNFVRQREDSLRRDVLTDADQMIGMTPKQPLRSGQMITVNDIQKPIAVPRGGLVTMILKYGPMTLTAQGRAVEPGAVGDIIRVANASSNQVVEAKIDSANTVLVSPNGGGVLAN